MGKRKNIMLCYPLEERRFLEPKFGWRFPVIAQPKLDGERCRALVSRGSVTLLSSEENEITQLPHIENALLDDIPIELELDGELWAPGLSFPEIHSIVSRKTAPHPDHERIEYHVFDLPLEITQSARTILLNEFFKYRIDQNGPIKLVESKYLNSLDEILTQYKEYIDAGLEGIIVRHPDLIYTRKRSTWMLKFKPKKEDIYEIVDIIEAISENGAPLGRVGKFICLSPSSGDEFLAGLGHLTHSEGTKIWGEKERFIGKEILVQYQASTQEKPRFALAVKILD